MGKLATKKASFKIIKTKAVVEMLSKKVAQEGTGGTVEDGGEGETFQVEPTDKIQICICQVKCEYLCANVGSSC